jgi:hypothetical protein
MNNRPKPKPRPEPKLRAGAIDADFEEIPAHEPVLAPKGMLEEDRSMIMQMQESKLQTHLRVAREHPRNINRSVESMVKMATWDADFADAMHYTVPRGGKMITGESIRFAEVVKQAWPNCECDAIVLAINKKEKYVVVRGYFLDYENNNQTEETVYRSIRDKNGNVYSDDMIAITCNAACSIAVRNAILAGVPRPLWMNASKAAREKAATELEGLPKKRQEVLAHFMKAGVAPDRVLATLGVRSEAQLTGQHITSLRGMWTALSNGDATLDELFPPIRSPVAAEPASAPDAPPKRARKTLEDLGEEEAAAEQEAEAPAAKPQEAEVPAAKPKPKPRPGAAPPDAPKPQADARLARERLIKQAADDGAMGFHKGLESVPARYAVDAELAAAWQDAWETTKAETEAEEDAAYGDAEEAAE